MKSKLKRVPHQQKQPQQKRIDLEIYINKKLRLDRSQSIIKEFHLFRCPAAICCQFL